MTRPLPGRRKRRRRRRTAVAVLLVLLGSVWIAALLLHLPRTPPPAPFPRTFMTEGGEVFAIRLRPDERPDVPEPHPETGEPGWPAFQCNNPRCPGRANGRKYVFPVRLGRGQTLNDVPAFCPECLRAGYDRWEALLTSRYVWPEDAAEAAAGAADGTAVAETGAGGNGNGPR